MSSSVKALPVGMNDRLGERELSYYSTDIDLFRNPFVLMVTSLSSLSMMCNQNEAIGLGPVVQKPINANPRLKINQGVYFSTPKCCSTLIFGKNLHWKKSILKNKKRQTKFSPKSGKHETKFTLTLD